jgi:hypothetical protein
LTRVFCSSFVKGRKTSAFAIRPPTTIVITYEIHHLEAQESTRISQPRVPKQPKRLNDWKAAWRKVRGKWKNAATYTELAQIAGFSSETIADIVKAGDAGLLD